MILVNMQTVKWVGIAALAIVLTASSVLADCKADLADIDKKIADSNRPELAQVLKMMRDQGAAACDAGDEQGARTAFKSISMMLGMPDPSQNRKPAVEPEPVSVEVALPEAHTVYISSEGEGILRYTVPGGEGKQYTFVTGAFTGDPRMPIETIGSDGAAFSGPHIARYLWGISGRHIPIDKLVLTLYERDTQERVALFKLVVDDAKAEPRENCGEVNPRTDECSIKRP